MLQIPKNTTKYEALPAKEDDIDPTNAAHIQQASDHAYGRRMKLRIGMTFALVALVGAGMKITQGTAAPVVTHPGNANSDQEKFNPCAAAPTPTQPSFCAAFHGQFYEPSKSCCAASCGAFCGAINCQSAPAGYEKCCTSKFTKLCGSPGVVAPCSLPRTVSGAVQLVVDNLAAFREKGGVAAVVDALSELLGVPSNDITAQIATAAGRRLDASVNVNYVLRVNRNSSVTPEFVVSKSSRLLPVLQGKLDAASLHEVRVQQAIVPRPATQEPGIVVPAATTTILFETLTTTPAPPTIATTIATNPPTTTPVTTTPSPTTPPTTTIAIEYIGLIRIDTNASREILASSESRAALDVAIAKVFGIPRGDVEILGESDGQGASVNAGYQVSLSSVVTIQMIKDKGPALMTALQAEYDAGGIKAIVTSVSMGTPQEMTTSIAPTPGPANDEADDDNEIVGK